MQPSLLRRRATVVTDDGVDLAVVTAGSGDPWILVHGFGGAKEDFADHLDHLGAASTVVVFDHRGHGDSGRPDDPASYTLDRLAADTFAVADGLGHRRFGLLGHSMGGMVARRVALAAPDRVERLVLMDTAAGPPVGLDPDLVDAAAALARSDWPQLRAVLDANQPLSTPAYERLLTERPGFREFGEWKWARLSPVMWAALAPQVAREPDALGSLGAITCPTLVLVGAQDHAFYEPSRAMAAAIPGAELVVIPDAGHHPQFENPRAWRAAVERFMAPMRVDTTTTMP